MKCPKCNFENTSNSKFCINCATSLLKADQKVCPNCKMNNPSEAKFCLNCSTGLVSGTPLEQKTQIYSDTNYSREEELKREIEKLKKKNSLYLKPKRKKRGIIAIAVFILIILILSISAYFIWFRSFQTQTQKSVQETSSGTLGSGLQFISITDDGKAYYVVIKNTNSYYLINIDSYSFKRDWNNFVSSSPSVATLNPGESRTFKLVPSGSLATGQTRYIYINGKYSNGQEVATGTYYTDS